jgi:hypothetical protein
MRTPTPLVLILAVLLGWPGAVPGQSGQRNIVRTQTDNQGGVSADLARQTGWRTARGFNWEILLQQPDGAFKPVPPNRAFRTGEAFRLEIEADTDLWVYVLNRGPDNSETVLFPEQGEEHLLIRKEQQVTVPAAGQFRFADPPGTERLRILAASEKLAWVNPGELFRLEAAQTLDPAEARRATEQKALRTKELAKIEGRQAPARVLDEPLSRAVDRMARDPARGAGLKDTVVVAPLPERPSVAEEPTPAPAPPPSRYQVARVSSSAADRSTFVCEVRLRHQ